MDVDERVRRMRGEYRIALECGCVVASRNPPLTGRVRYGCTSGLGHGYRLGWVSWRTVDGSMSRVNGQVAS